MSQPADLRTHLATLEALGDLQHIPREVSPDLEAAAITRRSTETGRPAPFFEHVHGVEPGFRMVGAPCALSSIPGHPLARVALSFGLLHTASAAEIVEHLVQARSKTPIPPRTVDAATAPCKQNILLGDEARLGRFPIPTIHQADGGPYVNTWGVVIARTPDGRWTNWSISRFMQVDDRHMTGLVLPGQHLGMVWREWEALGEPMPFAIAQGGDPGVPAVGAIPLPAGTDESSYLGALRDYAVDVVRCETNDLLVPAGSEVVIEGHLSPTRDTVEGPFAEFHGYALPETSLQPLFTIDAITYRDDPIWPVVVPGRPVDDSQAPCGPGVAAEVVAALREAGLPVTTGWTPLETACHWMVLTVPADWRELLPGVDTAEFTHRIGEVMTGTRAGRLCPVTYVLDDDIDPSNDSDLLWALGTRVHPAKRQESFEGNIMPWYQCYLEEELHAGHGVTVVHDGLLPAFGAGRAPQAKFDEVFPAELRARILAAEKAEEAEKAEQAAV